jgi:hypothetical protein
MGVGSRMDWKQLRAVMTGSVDQALLKRLGGLLKYYCREVA